MYGHGHYGNGGYGHGYGAAGPKIVHTVMPEFGSAPAGQYEPAGAPQGQVAPRAAQASSGEGTGGAAGGSGPKILHTITNQLTINATSSSPNATGELMMMSPPTHWLPELDANFFGNNWLSRSLLVHLDKVRFSVRK